MKVFTCTDHGYVWPTGVASIVVAPTEQLAREVLKAELDSRSLGHEDFTLKEVDLSVTQAIVLQDGNY